MAISINKFVTLILVALNCFISTIAQNIDDPKTTTISNDYSNLTGLWTGEVTYTQLGLCNYKNDSIHTDKTLFKIDFTDPKNLKIIQYGYSKFLNQYADYQDSTKKWYGEINPQNTLSLINTHSALCNGKSRTYEVYHAGKVYFKEGQYHLTINSEEEWCPDMGCKFNVSYTLKSTDSIFKNIVKIQPSTLKKSIIKKIDAKKSLYNTVPFLE